MNYRIEAPPYPGYIIVQEETGLSIPVPIDLDYPFWAEMFGWTGNENDLDGADEYLWAVARGEREPEWIDTDELDHIFDEIFPSAPDLDYETIAQLLDEEEKKGNIAYDEEGRRYVQVYVGDIRALTPSGKYYALLVCSNVTREEKEADEAWRARQDDMAECYDFALVSGDDPIDIFAVRYLD